MSISGGSMDETNASNRSRGEQQSSHNQSNGNGGQGASISFTNIVDFLKDHQRQMYTRETEWLFEKSQMQQRVNQLEAQLKGQENINQDLIKRIKMLEFSLRQERVKYAKLAQGNSNIGNTDIIGTVLQKANLNTHLYEKIAKRRAKAQRPLLLKLILMFMNYLQGYEDIFNTDEIQEIKALYDKAQEELKENLNNPNYQQQLEEKLLQDENLQKQLGIEERVQQKQEEGKALSSLIGSESSNVSKKELKPKYQMRSHFDIVRGVKFIPEIDIMASISEDCTLKLWSLKNLENQIAEQEGNLTPYITIRGHTGPLFSIAGPHNSIAKTIFTAGKEVNQYGDTYDGKSYCIGMWQENIDEAFWDIRHHPYANMLLSISSSGSIRVWDTSHIQPDVYDNKEKVINSFMFQDSSSKVSKDFQDVPTSCTWLENQQTSFAVGYRSSLVALFDNNQSAVSNTVSLYQPSLQNPYQYQINSLVCHQSMSLLASGHENGAINYIDYNSNKTIKTIEGAHSESVSCIKFVQQNGGLNIISGSHDGSIKIWDLRNHQCVAEISKAHERKYDEGVNCIDTHSQIPIFASGGGDCVVNLYELNIV